MVKGISRQVIVVQSPDRKLFDQAIFILSDSAAKGAGVTDEQLLREAKLLVRHSPRKKNNVAIGMVSAFLGALISCGVWIAVMLL